jgi:hypothetical protein
MPHAKQRGAEMPPLTVQFGLKTFLALVACAALASFFVYWAMRQSEVRAAERKYVQACAALEAEAGGAVAVSQASAEWLAAEQRVPLARRQAALAAHVDRLASLVTDLEQCVDRVGADSNADWLRNQLRTAREAYRAAANQLRAAGGDVHAESVEREMRKDPFSRALR